MPNYLTDEIIIDGEVVTPLKLSKGQAEKVFVILTSKCKIDVCIEWIRWEGGTFTVVDSW